MRALFVVPLVVSCGMGCRALLAQAQAGAPQGTDHTILRDYDEAIADIAEKTMRAVVQIEVTGYGQPEDKEDEGDDTGQTLQRQRSLGSGVIVDPDGYIVTNNHLVEGALRIRVILSPTTVEMQPNNTSPVRRQRRYDAKLVGTTRYADLALIKIEEKNLPFLPLPNEEFQVHLGETVIAIGSPEGLDHTVTKGIVSAVGRQPDVDRPMVYVQTDAPINPGNSGGPLVDRNGNLVGINTFILTNGGGSEGLGFAIPEPVVRFAYVELKAHGVIPSISIGAHAQTITAPLAAGLNLPQDWGVIISDVASGGPAEVGGLKPGDVIASVDGQPIDSLPKFTALMYVHPRGRPMVMDVLRNGKTVSLKIEPAQVPQTAENLTDLIDPTTDLIPQLGIFCIDLQSKGNGSYVLPPTRSKTGVVVAGILSAEPSTVANLQTGDVIRTMNGRAVTDTAQLRQDLARMRPDDAVVFEVERQGVVQFVAFEIE